ncbi:Zn2-C6 fungal-type DNA-binding domain [Fusarium oxysporum f. sp. vasinfectum]|nr:Zn2-C6 fungal-type DNA-binding domain [Fusarium oxysporum f. sp. vasinfectum]
MARKGKSKVKSGCKTCKLRKVKCDEGRPACQRCLSTGRVCDGYGIWGGGSHALTQHSQSRPRFTLGAPLETTLVLSLNANEKLYFDWFKCRTSAKISATFSSGFWNTLVFQAGSREPAVLHALLALSSAHKKGVVTLDIHRNSPTSQMSQQEQFTLQQYVKAIAHLQPHFNAKDKESCRVALITCVVFVCLEFFRGHFATAQLHLRNGLDILWQMQGLPEANSGILALKPCHESTDAWIVEALSRLHIQVELFRLLYHHSCVILQPAHHPEKSFLESFANLNDAWKGLELVYNQIFHLTHRARQQTITATEHTAQQLVKTRLAQWHGMFQDLMKARPGGSNIYLQKAYQILRIHYAMTNVMAETCIYNNETIYDTCTDKFILLIKELTKLWELSLHYELEDEMPLYIMTTCMPRSIIDMGWIPPLYFTAVKCRVHRIRVEAIKLLRTSPHREGIWDAHIAACVAKKVVELEEGNFYGGVEVGDDFQLNTPMRDLDYQVPLLPESRRMSEVEAELSGAPMDKILLSSNVRRAAAERLNEAFPVVGGNDGEDELRNQIEKLVNEYIDKTFSLASPNLSINGLPVSPDSFLSESNVEPETVYEPFDTRKRRRVADLITQEEKLLEDVAALKRSVPATTAEAQAEQLRDSLKRDDDMLEARKQQIIAEAAEVDLDVQPLERQDGVEKGFRRAVEGLGRLKRDMPAVVAKMERARVAGEYVVTQGR